MRKNKFNTDKNTGFGNNTETIGNRLFQKNGNPNTAKSGIGFWNKISMFHSLLKIEWYKFILLTFVAFIVFNIFYTILYYIAGIQHLNGIQNNSISNQLISVFFFSVQTFTTVGYGHISPNNITTSAISGIEAFTGLLFFALVTGLLYARFSKPNAFIKFSYNAVIAPYENITALMFRIVPYKNNHLTEAEVKLSLALIEENNGKRKMEFYSPSLEIDKINSLVLSWTIVHPINSDSPLHGLTMEQINEAKLEVLVFVKAFDETYSTTVVARSSYLYNEIKWGYKFKPMYERSTTNSATNIDVTKLNDMAEVKW
jgi:inward rectifier potassium channel